MPSGIADYGTSYWAGLVVGANALPASYYVALCTAEPGIAMDGTILAELEPTTGTSYARQSYATGASYWSTNGNYATNVNDIDFGSPTTSDWGLITHFALCDAASGGNLYAWGEFLNPVYVSVSYHIVVPAGGIILSMSSLDNSIAV